MWKVFDRTDVCSVEEMGKFVYSHSKGHFLQMPCWAEVKNNWKWCGISIYRSGQLIATAGILIRPLILGMTLFYIPRGPVSSRNDLETWNEMMLALRETAKKYRGVLL